MIAPPVCCIVIHCLVDCNTNYMDFCEFYTLVGDGRDLCERLVNKRLLESYSAPLAQYIQCSKAVRKYGMLGKHPTTGAAIASSFSQLLMNFQKQANLLWYEIYDIVKQNCTNRTGNRHHRF